MPDKGVERPDSRRAALIADRDEKRAIALKELLEYLNLQELQVGVHSDVAVSIGSKLPNSVMGSAVHTALRNAWIIRLRDKDVRDHYDNPITLKITASGRAHLQDLLR